jgi:pimeloyl-ACP methyl ester carboxylesterase
MLVLLPGMDGTGDLCAEFVAALGLDFPVITVRYPTTEFLDYTALVALARSRLPSERPFVLLGESFSGPVAISLAASAPPGLVGLILCCSFARNPHRWFRSLRFLLQLVPVKHIPITLAARMLLGRFASPERCSAFGNTLAQVSPAVLRARMRTVLTIDVTSKLKEVSVPVLYLRASEDRVVPSSVAEDIAKALPHVRIVNIKAPHFLLQALPSEAAQIVREFLHEVIPI